MLIQYPEAVDPQSIAKKELRNGFSIPCIGYGTFSAKLSPREVAEAAGTALGLGYRMLDCAAAYGNEEQIGQVIADAVYGGLPREELYILGKLQNTMHGRGNVEIACRKTLSDLGLDYLDAYLVHWPVPNAVSPDAALGVFNSDSRPYVHEVFMDTWRGMEALVRQRLVRSIGVSNVTVAKLKLLLRDAMIAPVINEMELHPTFQQEELFAFSVQSGVLPVAYSPIGSPLRPERNKMPGDLVDTEDPIVVCIADAHQVSPAVVCIKWAVQRGQVPVPFSANPKNMLLNLQAVTSDPLSDAEMAAMKAVDQNCRLSRGLSYLWPGAVSYRELWEERRLTLPTRFKQCSMT